MGTRYILYTANVYDKYTSITNYDFKSVVKTDLPKKQMDKWINQCEN